MFTPDDFIFDQDLKFCTCPAGKRLYRNGNRVRANRQVAYFHGRSLKAPDTFTSKMKHKIDTTVGQLIYSERLGTAEQPFAQNRHIMGLNRFIYMERQRVTLN